MSVLTRVLPQNSVFLRCVRLLSDSGRMPSALVILAEGAEEMETVISVDVMRRGGVSLSNFFSKSLPAKTSAVLDIGRISPWLIKFPCTYWVEEHIAFHERVLVSGSPFGKKC